MPEWLYAVLLVLTNVLWLYSEHRFTKYLQAKAKDGTSVKICGEWYRIVPAKKAIEWEIRENCRRTSS
jgi:hypothetical protein